jgi:zinc/manganese transport system substrate-binding protein
MVRGTATVSGIVTGNGCRQRAARDDEEKLITLRARPVIASGAALLMVAGPALAGCGPATPPGRGIAVVVAENVWGNVISQIGGSHVSVTSVIKDPSIDPHSYEADPQVASTVSTASFVVENGAGYDDFMDNLLSTDPSSSRDLVNVARVVGATGGSTNPHLWYNPAYVTSAARAFEAHLASHDPADSSAFEANLRTFLAAYQPYVDTLQAIKNRHAGAPVGYTERLPGYLVADAGLRLATPAPFAQAIEDGNDPSPADVAAMDRAVSQHQVRVLIYNAQVTSPATEAVKSLAIAAAIPVVGMSETIPAGQPSFQAWQIEQAQSVLAALGG